LISLHHLTALDVDAAALARIAAALGCDAICIFSYLPPAYRGQFPCIETMQSARALKSVLKQTGIRVCNLEVFNISPELSLDDMLPGLERGAELGATNATVHIRESDEGRAADGFGRFCTLASDFDLRVGLEFTGFSAVKDIRTAARIIERSGAGNAGIAADALHVFRNDLAVEDLIPYSSMISYAQICDGKLAMPDGGYRQEAIANREIPGHGEFPLRNFLSVLPTGTPISIEVPLHRLRDAGISALERARFAVEGAMKFLGVAQHSSPA
jgi:sugar phosphate isomerase/epimerase